MKEIRRSELDTTYIQLALCFACFLQSGLTAFLFRFLRFFAQVFQSLSPFCWALHGCTDKVGGV
jgi:hypothetical protein